MKTTRKKRTGNGTPKLIALALQGGGAHGAFAWGVLDRLLEDGRVAVEGVSATSAGAMNAVVLAYGLLKGGPENARLALRDFWQAVAKSAQLYSPFRQMPFLNGSNEFGLRNSPWYMMTEIFLRVLSPYQFNPHNMNPLREILEQHVDFAALRQHCPIDLFLCATNVETSKMRIFSGQEMCIEAVLASACLPTLFQAIEINGEHYWDGGYVGNPAIFPLIYNCSTHDVVIIHINPIMRPGVPTTAVEILNRVNEVSFNSSLMREMRAIAFVTGLIQKGSLDKDEIKEMYIHSIRSDQTMAAFGASSKYNADWDFFCFLHDKGWREADVWLKENYHNIGKCSSIDLGKEFL